MEPGGKYGLLVAEVNDDIGRCINVELRHNGRVLAFASILPVGGIWVFQTIQVAGEHRAKGYGSAVLQKLIEYLDINKIDLYTCIHSSGSLDLRHIEAWYKRYGFVECMDRGYHLVRYHKSHLYCNK